MEEEQSFTQRSLHYDRRTRETCANDRIPDALRPQSPSPGEVWWLRLAGEAEPYVLEVAHLTLRWGKVKGIH